VGLLFLDFEVPKRLRVNGHAEIIRDVGRCAAIHGAAFLVRVHAEGIFPNCPRYLHQMQLVEESLHAPRPGHEPPVPAWKTFEAFRDALPERDR
jgi:uncharacterized protein